MSLKKTARKLLIVAGILIVIIALLQAIANYYINHHLAEDLEERVKSETKGKYKLNIETAAVSFFRSAIRLDNISLEPVACNTCFSQTVRLKADYISLTGVNIIKLLQHRSVFASNLDVGALDIRIYRSAENSKPDTAGARLSLYRILSPKVNEVRVGQIDITDTRLHVYKGISDTAAILGSNDNDIHIHNFMVNKTADSLGNLFLAEKFNMTMRSFAYKLNNDLFWLRGKKMSVNYNDSLIRIDSLFLDSRYSKQEIGKAAGKRVGWTNLKMNGIELSGINPDLFLERNWLVSRKLEIGGMDLEMYVDMNLPHKHETKPTVQEIVKDIPFTLRIDTIRLNSSNFVYSMLQAGAQRPGAITLTKLTGRLTGVTNDSTPGAKHKMTMMLKTYFMNEGLIHATYVFPLNTRKEVFECSGSVGAMSLIKTSEVLKRIANISIRKGELDSVRFSFRTDGDKAVGWMKFMYHDLEIDLVKENAEKQKLREKLLTFFANEFIVKDRNPDNGGQIRVTGIDYKRDPTRYLFFNSWKALQTAILPAIGLKNANLIKNNAKK